MLNGTSRPHQAFRERPVEIKHEGGAETENCGEGRDTEVQPCLLSIWRRAASTLTTRHIPVLFLAVHRFPQRLLAAIILAFWLAPGASALAVGLHVVLDHHSHGDQATRHALLSLARAAVHGHHHDLGTAWDHDHDVITIKKAPASKPSASSIATLPLKNSLGAAEEQSSILGPTPQCRPPTPLFAAHSSLLL